MNDDADSRFLIVTGSSAGGIEALRAFVGGLPSDLPAAVVIAQHLAPNHVSRLPEILAHHTVLPVITLQARETLRDRTIFVVPPDRDVEIVDGEVLALRDQRAGAKPSVDRLFATAAEQFGDRVIGVVLSGMGNDGLAGARAIKEGGGAVVIQDPASAGFPSMPLAVPPTIVDIVAKAEELGGLISALIDTSREPAASSDQQRLRDLLLELRDRSGIDFLQYKMPTIQRRLGRLMVAANTPTLPEYVKHLEENPDAYQRLVGAFLIKVTEFFRDAALFEALRERVLPRLMNEAAEQGRELRLWSAGCSTGEEAYSLAILCAELMRARGRQLDVRIFATDLDPAAINFARRGRYGAEDLRHVPEEWIERYFVPVGDMFEIKNLRNITVFGHHDLARRAPFPRIDLILCRNVLIYFVKELQTRALQLFAFSLRDGGVLALGKSESTSQLEEYFEPLDPGLKLFERVGKRSLIPPLHIKNMATSAYERISSILPATVWDPQNDAGKGSAGRPNANEMIGTLIQRSTIGVAIVDRRYDLLVLNDAARGFLEIHGVGVGQDLLHLARNLDSNKMRDLIDAAFRAEFPQAEELYAGMADGTERWLSVAAHTEPSASNKIDGVALTFVDVSDAVRARHELETRDRVQRQSITELSAQVADLARRQRGLLQGNEELTTANSQLRILNEQLVISCEEAASASEEIETLYEEMQATNEELETLNEELQSTVEELNTTNDELEARTAALQHASESHESSVRDLDVRWRALSEALTATGKCVAVVDSGGSFVYLNPRLEAVTGLLRTRESWWTGDGSVDLADGTSAAFTVRKFSQNGEAVYVVLLK